MKDKLSTFGHLGNLFPVGERTLIYSGKIPLFAKIAVTAFLSVLLPVYLHTYGPTNFLWFCDAALIVTVGGMWLESSLLISMCAVGILVPQLLWLVDFFINLLGAHFLNLTGYMFDPQLSFFIRGLSLFHGWLPLLLIWLLHRVGYDTRALVGWSTLATGLVIVCYLFTPASGPHPASSNLPIDINYVYGFSDQRAQTLINQNLYVILWLGALWLGAYLPTHLILRKFFPASKPLVGLRLPLELL